MEIQYFRVILELTGGEFLSPPGYIEVAVYRANNGWMVTREDGAWHQVVD
jgi:hypothetical protein